MRIDAEAEKIHATTLTRAKFIHNLLNHILARFPDWRQLLIDFFHGCFRSLVKQSVDPLTRFSKVGALLLTQIFLLKFLWPDRLCCVEALGPGPLGHLPCALLYRQRPE